MKSAIFRIDGLQMLSARGIIQSIITGEKDKMGRISGKLVPHP